MIALLARVSGVPGAVHPGALQALLQQGAGCFPGLEQLQRVWPANSRCTAGSDFDSASPTTSTSYVAPLTPHHHHHRRYPCHSRIQLQQRQLTPASAPEPLMTATATPLQLQQLRAYRIPNRVAPPKVAYSVRCGRPAPQPWPELEPVKVPPQGEVRWHRNVVRFPPEVAVQLEESPAGSGGGGSRTLVLSGKAGTIRLNMQELDATGLLAFRLIQLAPPTTTTTSSSGAAAKQPSQPPSKPPAAAAAAGGGATGVAGTGRSVLVLVGPNKSRFDEAVESINSAIRGVMSGYLVGLTVKGVGYRMEPVEDDRGEVASRVPQLSYAQLLRRSRAPGGPRPKPYYFEAAGEEKNVINFPYSKPASAIRLKVGYSRTVVYPLPPHIRAFCLKPTLVYLYGLEMDELQRVAAEIRSIRKPNPYTGNGVQYVDEVVKLKQRARAK